MQLFTLLAVLPFVAGLQAPFRRAPTAISVLSAEPNGTAAIQRIVERRLPKQFHDQFTFSLNASAGDEDNFMISQSSDKRINIVASSTSSLSRGLLTYLRTVGGDIFWSSDTFSSIPSPLPDLQSPINQKSWAKLRYMFNVVTFSYTMAFYSWEDWEYLIDWCALHGINFPLAINGQEYIWREVYRDYGLNDSAIYDWFAGPAFHSWARMGNIRGSWGSDGEDAPVTEKWIDDQWELQKKIVSRMVSLGMTPILPGFAGFLPPEMHDAIGGPEFIQASVWEDLPDTYTKDTAIDPTWSTFSLIQKSFLQKQFQLYGNWTSHYYSIDLFNELNPSSLDPAYLTNNTRAVVQSLRAVDEDAVWVMQGWMFVSASYWNSTLIKALLGGAEEGEMIVLDLSGEGMPAWDKTENYFGQKWVWNLLHDYGQNQGLYGALEHYVSEPLRALSASPDTLVGLGLTPEGLNQNEIVYELMLDIPWQTTPINISSWVESWLTRRYSLSSSSSDTKEAVVEAWNILSSSAYNNTNPNVTAVIKSIFELTPDISGLTNRTGHHPTLLTYDPRDVVSAWHILTDAVSSPSSSSNLMESEAFRYDYVDVTRQVMANLFIEVYDDLIRAWNQSIPDTEKVAEAGQRMQDILSDMDDVLGTDENFLLGRWTGQAKSLSNGTESDTQFLEFEARNQITVWGPADEVPWKLNRYASKQWSDVVRSFYRTSWAMFVEYLRTHAPPASGNGSVYNQTEWLGELLEFERSWGKRVSGDEDDQPRGEVEEAVERVRERWDPVLEEYYGRIG